MPCRSSSGGPEPERRWASTGGAYSAGSNCAGWGGEGVEEPGNVERRVTRRRPGPTSSRRSLPRSPSSRGRRSRPRTAGFAAHAGDRYVCADRQTSPADPAMLTLRDLLSDLDVRAAAGDGGLDASVRWVHISEL